MQSSGGGVFLSHSSKDRSFVLGLSRALKNHRYGAAHILGAKQWHDEIGRALGKCSWFLVVLTPDSVRSQWVKRELLFALNDSRYNERIIPLLRKPCDHSRLSWTLSEFQFVNFTGNFEKGCQELLRIWKMEFKSPIDGRRRERGSDQKKGGPKR
jgi:hypothetical protein